MTTTQKILNVLGCEEFVVSVSIVTKEEIAELNERYRSKTGPTDVLSFPQLSKNEVAEIASFVRKRTSPTQPLLGDVVIAPEIARVQANELKRTLDDEIVYLIVHSILHLLGYDHEDPMEAKRMRHKENEVLMAIEHAIKV